MTQEEIIEMARQALKQEPREDWNSTAWVFADETLEAFAKLVAEKEREACAKVCEQSEIPIPIDVWHGGTKKEMTKHTALALTNAIRARGQA